MSFLMQVALNIAAEQICNFYIAFICILFFSALVAFINESRQTGKRHWLEVEPATAAGGR